MGVSIIRGTKIQLRIQKKLVDGYYRGEARRHAKVGMSCADCKPLTCDTNCGGIRTTEGLSSHHVNLRKRG